MFYVLKEEKSKISALKTQSIQFKEDSATLGIKHQQNVYKAESGFKNYSYSK